MAENGVHLEERNEQDAVAEGRAERAGARAREQRAFARARDKVEEAHLPTPPPDPWAASASSLQGVQAQRELKRPRSLEEEEDIIAYLTDIGASPFEGQTSECPSRNSTASTMADAGLCSGEAFEHLDRLYSLTEQVLELRSRSSKLFRRVRDLEKLKVLRNADRRLENAFARNKELETNYCEEDTGFAESLLDAMLSNCREPQLQRRNLRSPYSRQRSRSLALSEQSLPRLPSPAARSEAEKGLRNNGACNAPKVSKWTRVKAAFKWERACANDSVDATDATVTTPTTPTTKYLRIPEAGSGNWSGSTLSPSTSEVSGPSTPFGRVSSASSSNEGSYDGPRKNSPNHLERQSLKAIKGEVEMKGEGAGRRSRSLDGDMVVTSAAGASVGHASEIGTGKPLIRITSDSNPMIRSSSIPEKGRSEIMTKRAAPPTLTITIPSNEEDIRGVSSPESTSPLAVSGQNSRGNSPQCPRSGRQEASREFKRQRSTIEDAGGSAKMQRHDSKWNKVRRAFLTNAAFSVPPSPVRILSGQAFPQDGAGTPRAQSCSGSVEDLEKSSLTNSQAETRRDYQALREKLGAEFHRKLVEWERLKNASPRNGPRNARESISLAAGGGSALSGREALLPAEERLAPEFKKKLQDWKRAKKGRRGSATLEQQRVHRRRLTDWQLWRSPSKPDTRSQDTLGSNPPGDHGKHHFCEDFVRRMEVWRRMNEGGSRPSARARISQKLMTSSTIDETEFLPLEKVFSGAADRIDRDRRDSDARQLEECFDAETRMTDSAQNASCNNEILIRTSVGSYRFEGISREFTRKLYDWEKYRGISPRSSTFRLLGPGYAPFAGESDPENTAATETSTKVADDEKNLGILKKSKSEGNVTKASSGKDNFARRSSSLQYLDRLTNKLDDADRGNTSPAPNNSRGTVDASDDTIMDDSEPEAMIVDIEDVIEETASPLERVQPHQTPVYSVAASETTSIAVPLGTVTSSHEPSPVYLVEVENSPNRKHWENRSWNQRKTFSSDENSSPEHFRERKFRNRTDSSGDGETGAKNFDGYEPIEWCPTDKDSVKSDNSTGTYDSCQERILDAGQLEDVADGGRDGIPVVPSDGEESKDQDYRMLESQVSEPDANGDVCVSLTAFLPAASQDTRKLMDLSSEKRMESELHREDGEQDQDGSCDADQVTPVSERKIEYGHFQEISSDSSLESPQSTQYHQLPPRYPSSLSPSERNETRRSDHANHKVLQHDINILQYEKLSDMRSEIRNSETNCNSGIAKPRTETMTSRVQFDLTQSRNESQYQKAEKTSSSISHSSPSSDLDYKRGPTIRTTPLTITSSREERNFERIFINEKTLNKVVVPTVSRNDAVKRRSQSTESSDSKSTIEDSDSTREGSRAREANGKTTNSPTRNVLIKTKRMIFSPFRRDDKNKKESDTSEDERTLRGQSASKSRSTSPKISRSDTLLRMPLSLPWPLRPGGKDRDVRQEQKLEDFSRTRQTLRGTLFEKKDSRRTTITEIQRRVALRNNVRLIEARDEVRKCQREQQVDASIQATPRPDSRRTWTPVAQTVARSRPSDNRREDSLVSDSLSSDLIHKLNILSSVAARHDARTNSSSIEQAIESHSSRVRRAKESFLSRRGGPLCRSLFEPRPSNPDITKTARDTFRRAPSSLEQLEHANGDGHSEISDEEVRTLISEEAVIKEHQVARGEKLLGNSGSDLSDCSRPDLVKSASAGMINVDPDTFDRLTEQTRGCESLPRTISKPREPSGALAKIVSKFKFSKFIRAKEAEDSMSTISRLCRQSLLIDIRSGFEDRCESEDLSDRESKGKENLRRNDRDPKK